MEMKLANIVSKIKGDITVFSGTAAGADILGEWWAHRNGHKVKRFPPNWELYGKKAGPKRNEEMVQQADALIAFWDGLSSGTANMIQVAKEHHLKVRVIKYKGSALGSYLQNTSSYPCKGKRNGTV